MVASKQTPSGLRYSSQWAVQQYTYSIQQQRMSAVCLVSGLLFGTSRSCNDEWMDLFHFVCTTYVGTGRLQPCHSRPEQKFVQVAVFFAHLQPRGCA